MAKSILDKVEVKTDFYELLGAGVIKYFTEKALKPVVSNGTYISGATKLGLGVVADQMKLGKFGNMLKTALIMDGVEDITLNLSKMIQGFVPNLAPQKSADFQTI